MGYGVKQFALVLEVVIGRSRADAGFPGDSAQGEGRGAVAFEQATGRINQGAAEIAVVIGPGFGCDSFSMACTVILYRGPVKAS